MAVSEQTPADSSTGNGVTTVFPYTFKIVSDEDLEVKVEGVLKALNTDYTVSGVGNDAGGDITFTTAPANLAVVTRRRNMAFVRDTDYQYQGDLPEDVLNNDQDAPVLMIQQLAEQVGRSLQVPVGEDTPSELPSAADRASMFLAFDGDGNPVAASGTGADAGLRTDLAATTGPALVGFVASGTGAVTQTVQSKLRQFVTLADFGASTAASSQTALIQAAIDSGAAVLDGQGLTYRVDTTLTLRAGQTIQNAVFDFSNAAIGDILFETGGADGVAQNIGSLSSGASSVAVTSGAAFAAGDLIWITSTDVFDFAASVKGEWQRVLSVATNTLNLYGRLRDSYTTAVKVYKPAMKRGITLKDLRLIGGGDTQNAKATLLSHVEHLRVTNVEVWKFGNRGLDIRRAVDVAITDCYMAFGDESTGASYGVVLVNGVESATVKGCTFEDLRHGVTIGGEDGVDRHVTVTGCTVLNGSDSGLDCHPNATDITFSGNTIDSVHSSAHVNANRDGITFQGAFGTITGNTVRGFKTIGIHIQPLTKAIADTVVVSGNNLHSTENSATGIFFDFQKPADTMRGVTCTGNVVYSAGTSALGIICEAQTAGGTIDGMTISGNRVQSASTALRLKSATGRVFQDIAVSGNALRNNGATTPVIELTGPGGTFLTAIIITGNTLRGGTYGVSNAGGDRVKVDANIMQAFATGATTGTLVGTSDNYSS